MEISYEDFRNLAQGIQAVGFFVATIAGGIWAVFKLINSKELDKTRSEAILLKSQIERKKGLTGKMNCVIGRGLSNNLTPIFIDVVIENPSTETHTLDWEVFPLKIAKVDISDSDGYSDYTLSPMTKISEIKIKAEGSNSAYGIRTSSTTLLPESKRNMKFLWNCPGDGIYLLCISAPRPKSITDYVHSSDSNGKINKLKEKYETTDPLYAHRFTFNISLFVQLSNGEIFQNE